MLNPFLAYLKRNIHEIKNGGFQIIFKKINGRINPVKKVLLFPFALSVLVIIRLLYLIYPIKIQKVDIGRIGHIYPAFSFLMLKKKEKLKKAKYLFYFDSSSGVVSNFQLKKMLKRQLFFVPFGFLFNEVRRINKKILGSNCLEIEFPYYKVESKNWLDYKYPCSEPLLLFTEEEVLLGEENLRKLGINENEIFICFHIRDSAYLSKIQSDKDWSYHDYRDASIKNYLIALEKFAIKNGIKFLRMGSITLEKFDREYMNIIDYSNSKIRSDFLDIYLSSRCEFFIGSDSGMSVFPEIQGKPIIFLNIVPLARLNPWAYLVFYIPKKFYSRNEKRLLTFDEIINKYIKLNPDTSLISSLNIELQENSIDEIYDAVDEFDKYLKNNLMISSEDLDRQSQYWKIQGNKERGGKNLFVSFCFLQKYKELLK